MEVYMFRKLRKKKLVHSIVSILERVNIKMEYNQHSSVLEITTIITEIVTITFILFKRSINNFIDFIFLSCCEKSHDNNQLKTYKQMEVL